LGSSFVQVAATLEADAALTKPVGPEELLAVVQKLLG
jgi:DNA-binding response OmpR family regulator